MLTFAFLSTLLILSGIRIFGDDLDWEYPRSPTSAAIARDIRRCASYIEPVFYGDFVQPLQRRLLEHSRRTKQVYRSYDYNVARGHRQTRNKLNEGRPYRSLTVKDNEDENEEEEEEEEEEEDQNNDEDADEETAEQDEEEPVAVAAAAGARNRVARSGYAPFRGEANEERREIARIRSVTEECEDESMEPPQYYEYETEVRNIASQDARCNEHRAVFPAKVLGASLLIFLLA